MTSAVNLKRSGKRNNICEYMHFGRDIITLIQRDNAIPLYYQLETILRRKIFAGKFSREKALPSEDTLAAEYEVSRITVRQALSSLEQEGLVIRQRGRGTFVSGKAVPFSPPKLTGSIEDLISIEYVSVLYRADKYSYTVNLKRKRNSDSGAWGSA